MKINKNILNKNNRLNIVILDTDFLMHAIENKINFINEIRSLIEGAVEICILESTIKELQKIATTKPWKYSTTAKLALEMLQREKIKILNDKNLKQRNTDEKIAFLARKMKSLVATDDKELRRKLLKENVRVICIRQGRKLILIG